jgi:inhibitor of cysteine peptidase
MNKIQAVLLVLSCTLAGCTGMSSTVDGKTHVFSQKQKCPTLLEMDVNQTLELTLDENPSTGFGWSLEKPLKLFKVEETYLSDLKASNESTIVGKGGQKVFKLTAVEPGEELIHIKHARAWENGAPIDEWKCRVRIS